MLTAVRGDVPGDGEFVGLRKHDAECDPDTGAQRGELKVIEYRETHDPDIELHVIAARRSGEHTFMILSQGERRVIACYECRAMIKELAPGEVWS